MCFKYIIVFIYKRAKGTHFVKRKRKKGKKIKPGWRLLNAFKKNKQIIKVTIRIHEKEIHSTQKLWVR